MNDRLKRMKIDTGSIKSSVVSKTSDSQFFDTKGIEYWAPQAVGTYLIRILPFEVKLQDNPDGRPVGSFWYRRLILTHYSIGEAQKSFLCPTMKGDACPVCNEVRKLWRGDYESNKQLIQSIKARKSMAYLVYVIDPKTGKSDRKPRVFIWGVGKFSNVLDNEIKQTDVRNLDFASVDNGKCIKFRVVEDSYSGNKFLKTDRLDFVENSQFATLTDDDVDSIVSIDDMLLIPDTDYVAGVLSGRGHHHAETTSSDTDSTNELERVVKANQEVVSEATTSNEVSSQIIDDGDDW